MYIYICSILIIKYIYIYFRYVPAHFPHLAKFTLPRQRADGPRTCLYAKLIKDRVTRSTTTAIRSRPSFSSRLLVEPHDAAVEAIPASVEDIVEKRVRYSRTRWKIRIWTVQQAPVGYKVIIIIIVIMYYLGIKI